MTALFEDVIFGPVRSRRLGLSLGVNLLPMHAKLCSFDCIYCECGWNNERRGEMRFNTREEVRSRLEEVLKKMVDEQTPPDVITFAGNGEPTLHPNFEQIIDDTIALRDALCPSAKISVLSNATQLHREEVCRALRRIDNNILKLDSAFDRTAQRINKPRSATYSVAKTVEQLKHFSGQMILQTMFLRGEYDSERIDNTTPEEVEAWLRLVAEIQPRQVMIYSLDRDTPCQTLEKVSKEDLQQIADQVVALGIECSVA
ncbi:MAG: radical SAM protein [Rikenellaceae bacterium]|nr:radical SAM protein [Rikenellaceae bacterium]